MPGASELPASLLRRVCDPGTFSFDTTAELPPLTEVLGQPRAVTALEFGVGIASHGFNLFALGQPGSGKTTLIREYLARRAAAEPVPGDICYVHNFENPRRPAPLRLPAGKARMFELDINTLLEELKIAIPKAFEDEQYSRQRDRISHQVEERRKSHIEDLEKMVEKSGFQLLKAPGGLVLAPSTGGKLIPEEELAKLSAAEHEKVTRVRERVQRDVETRLRAVRDIEKQARDEIAELDEKTAASATHHLMEELRSAYQDQPGILAWLDDVEHDVIRHADDFRQSKEGESAPNPFAAALGMSRERSFTRYQVNVVVDNTALKGAPVIVETNPTYHNLTGRIEHQSTLGEIHTDHTMIKPGALHRAAGGYLVIPARECLIHPYAWEGLKRAIKDRQVHIEELGSQLSLISTVTLDPLPVPLEAKVVLIGTASLYYLLLTYDEDFQKLFKVKTEFASHMARTPETEHAYALFAGGIANDAGAMPLRRDAVARIVEYGSRAAGDQTRLSTIFGAIADLIREAVHHASHNSHDAVTADDIRDAEAAQHYRGSLMEEHVQEAMRDGTILVETAGTAVGRINGLSVVGVGDAVFGHPSRITAAVGPGRGGVISIEREVEMSGPIHGKGVLILSGFLLRQYGRQGPLGLSASLVFEQLYGGVEGDSASMAELLCLISAISEVPLRQDVAVTGSVNQHGQIQPVGGVTEKIEGFYDACKARGLTGTQGVLLPAANQRNLMLRDDIVESAARGEFHVWTADSVGDALELLTGRPAADVHAAVEAELAKYRDILRAQAESKNGAKPA